MRSKLLIRLISHYCMFSRTSIFYPSCLTGKVFSIPFIWPTSNKHAHRFSLLRLDRSFSEKYRKAIIRSMDLCAVKKHIMDPPEFEIITTPA
ncbi:MAG: hypothetical protein JRI96_12960 [Deltaproteobacteria bacterium]|nr:hypothetical protein [Deltaproteobacteria bacterium]